jgi:hypothetical protein
VAILCRASHFAPRMTQARQAHSTREIFGALPEFISSRGGHAPDCTWPPSR